MHKLLTNQPGERMLLLGNEAIARGAIEAGVAFASTYPGTPSSELSLNFFQISKESDLYFEYSTNEKVSVEVAAAAAACGVRSMAMMKHVGLNVAADALMTLAYVGVKGGMVILTADDPAMFSSQNEQDNRYYAKLSGLPMLEPSTVDEARAIVAYAFDLSEKLQEPVLLRTTTRINHSSGAVTLGEIRPRAHQRQLHQGPLEPGAGPGRGPQAARQAAAEPGEGPANSPSSPPTTSSRAGAAGGSSATASATTTSRTPSRN